MIERIGLLFVHGIGEQKRFDFLRQSVTEFAELMKQSGEAGEHFSASVVDRTADWKLAPGEPHPNQLAPITLTLESAKRCLIFDCHEVWWADLGARTGLGDLLGFWIWGLGQWLAPIYRDLDAANLTKIASVAGRKISKPASDLVKLPQPVAGRICAEAMARLRLAMAGLATLFVVVTWVVLKRLFSALLNKAPSPTLLVSYVGDVRTYEERGAPGTTSVSDPGYPRRVGIRRRMVTEMVAMGARTDLDRWYVVAHSQGTVLAYNGLTEIGHALPNYLSEAQWTRLPKTLIRDTMCKLRPKEEIPSMMPARPAWLKDADVINRKLLFENLRGVITYGSPLNKFAAIWPRIVATATDRKRRNSLPFPDSCRWINLRALQDPVAGDVRVFFKPKPIWPSFQGFLPKLVNIDTPFGLDVLLSHLGYFRPAERFAAGLGIDQRRRLMSWIMRRDAGIANAAMMDRTAAPGTKAMSALLYLVTILLLGFAAIAAITMGGDLVKALFGKVELVWIGPKIFFWRTAQNVLPLLAAATAVLAGAGYYRWIREAWLNVRLAQADNKPLVVRLLRAQMLAALVLLVLSIAIGLATYWFSPPWACLPPLALLLIVSAGLCLVGILGQSIVNRVLSAPPRFIDTHP